MWDSNKVSLTSIKCLIEVAKNIHYHVAFYRNFIFLNTNIPPYGTHGIM